jgi:Rha family phage regulatory protein
MIDKLKPIKKIEEIQLEPKLVFKSEDGKLATNSLLVAEKFGKRHVDVLRDIRNLHCSEDFHQRNFALMVEMKELPQGGSTKTEYFIMSKDGFTFLAMGFTGSKAAAFKEDYINAFNRMEEIIRSEAFKIPKRTPKRLNWLMNRLINWKSNSRSFWKQSQKYCFQTV